MTSNASGSGKTNGGEKGGSLHSEEVKSAEIFSGSGVDRSPSRLPVGLKNLPSVTKVKYKKVSSKLAVDGLFVIIGACCYFENQSKVRMSI